MKQAFQKVECNSKTISKTLEKLVELYKKWTMPKDKRLDTTERNMEKVIQTVIAATDKKTTAVAMDKAMVTETNRKTISPFLLFFKFQPIFKSNLFY